MSRTQFGNLQILVLPLSHRLCFCLDASRPVRGRKKHVESLQSVRASEERASSKKQDTALVASSAQSTQALIGPSAQALIGPTRKQRDSPESPPPAPRKDSTQRDQVKKPLWSSNTATSVEESSVSWPAAFVNTDPGLFEGTNQDNAVLREVPAQKTTRIAIDSEAKKRTEEFIAERRLNSAVVFSMAAFQLDRGTVRRPTRHALE